MVVLSLPLSPLCLVLVLLLVWALAMLAALSVVLLAFDLVKLTQCGRDRLTFWKFSLGRGHMTAKRKSNSLRNG